MVIVTCVISILLSIFSTAVMSYISMAVPIGPWIAPTLVLLATVLFAWLRHHTSYSKQLGLVTAAGSVGGILATACGFSFPTLYFLDKPLFMSWMAQPFYFVGVMAGLAFTAGWFGVWIANVLEERLLIREQLAFPIGQLAQKMIAAQSQVKKSMELLVGFVGTTLFCFLQSGLFHFKGFIPRFLSLIPRMQVAIFRLPRTQLDFALLPMLLAIGFIAGHMIAVPLFVGTLAKVFITSPIHGLFFAQITSMEFLLAFCSGMVLSGAVFGFIKTPKVLLKSFKKLYNQSDTTNVNGWNLFLNKKHLIEFGLVVSACCAFLTYFKFPIIVQVYLLLFTFICTYQIAIIAGRIGLAQLGRFATFVMVPALFLFPINMVQIVLLSTFVQITGGVTADILFGRRLALDANINRARVRKFQYLGLVVSSLVVGVIFWLLMSHFELGSADLFAQKAYARRLLLDVKQFNYWVLAIGFVFGYILSYIKISPMLVLGGLLMPVNISLGLVLGGVLTLLCKDKEEYVPFWSGVFASNSIWMILQALIAACMY